MADMVSARSNFGPSLHLLSFNRAGSLLYFYQERPYFSDSYNASRNSYKIFSASVYGRSVHEIGEIDLPHLPDPTFDVEKEEIYWLGSVPHPSPEFAPILDQADSCLLILAIFGVSTGAVTRFCHLSDANLFWMPVSFSEDNKLLAFPVERTIDDLIIYAVSHLDSVNGTFELSPYITLAGYNTLEDLYQFPPNLASSQNRIMIINFTEPGQIMYFKIDTGDWVWENFNSEMTENEFQAFRTICTGSTIIEALRNVNQWTLRVLKANEKKEYELIYQISAPRGILECPNRLRLSSDGKLIAFVKGQNSRLSIHLRTSQPCNLQESCINVVWLCCRKNNDQLTDYEIGDLLGLSTLSNMMDLNFGKRFLSSRVEIPNFYHFENWPLEIYNVESKLLFGFHANLGDVMNEVDDNESVFMDEITNDGSVFMDVDGSVVMYVDLSD